MLKKNSIVINSKNTFNRTAKEITTAVEIVKLFENFEIQKKPKENSHKVVIKSVKSEQFQNLFKKLSTNHKENKECMKIAKNPVFVSF